MIAVSARRRTRAYALARLRAALQHPCVPAVSGAQKVATWRCHLRRNCWKGSAADVLREAYRWYQDKFNTLKLTPVTE